MRMSWAYIRDEQQWKKNKTKRNVEEYKFIRDICAVLQKDDNNNRNSYPLFTVQHGANRELSLFFGRSLLFVPFAAVSTWWFIICDAIVYSNMIYIKWETIYEDNKTAERTNEWKNPKK